VINLNRKSRFYKARRWLVIDDGISSLADRRGFGRPDARSVGNGENRRQNIDFINLISGALHKYSKLMNKIDFLCGLAGNIVSRQAAKPHKENKSRRQFMQQFMNICAKPISGIKSFAVRK